MSDQPSIDTLAADVRWVLDAMAEEWPRRFPDSGETKRRVQAAPAKFRELETLARRVEVADERHRIDLAVVKEQRDRAVAAEALVDTLTQERERLRDELTEWRTSIATESLTARAEAAEAALADMRRALETVAIPGPRPRQFRSDLEYVIYLQGVARRALAAAGPAPEEGE